MEIVKTKEELRLELAKERVQKLKKFYTHLFIYMIGLSVYLLKTYCGLPFNFFPIHFLNGFVMGIWTFFMVIEIFQMFISELFFGEDWENRKIKEIMDKEK